MVADPTELVPAAAAGDATAWNVIVDQYNGLLWSIARGYRLPSADAADAIQTTWLRLVENLARITDPARLPAWLATTLRRECLAALRRSGREQPTDDDTAWDVPDDAEPLDAQLLADERDAAIWRAVGRLPSRCQRLLRILMASPPPSYTAVAAALGLPVGSIGPTRQRCLDRLRGDLVTSGGLPGLESEFSQSPEHGGPDD
jgi:RNA polymerase sigma factor (sigma-70 family)